MLSRVDPIEAIAPELRHLDCGAIKHQRAVGCVCCNIPDYYEHQSRSVFLIKLKVVVSSN